MKTTHDILEIVSHRIDLATLNQYINRQWVKPINHQENWYFEDVDIARLQLVIDLAYKININDDGIDVVLSLLDQLYGLRGHIQKLSFAVAQQSQEIQREILSNAILNNEEIK